MSYLFSSAETDYLSTSEQSTKDIALTTFDNLKEGMIFPPTLVQRRFRVHRFNRKLYDGSAYENFYMSMRINNELHKTPYKCIPLNYFRLVVNKLWSLLFCSKPLQVKTVDTKQEELDALINKSNFFNAIHVAVKTCLLYGDSIIKVSKCEGKDALSVLTPLVAYKVVSKHDKQDIRGTVLFELLSKEEDKFSEVVERVEFIRILVVGKGYEYERVFRYSNGGKLGEPVDYWYKGRKIPKEGHKVKTGIEDASTCIWFSYNQDGDIYGESSFANIKQLVFALQNRLSCENYVLDNNSKPYLMVGMSSLRTDESTGSYYLKTIGDKYLVAHEGDTKPEYLEWNGHLTESANVRDALLDAFYSLSEISRSLVTGEFQGNVSEETFNNTIKSSLDLAGRVVEGFRTSVLDVLYVLCKLHGLNDIKRESLTLLWDIGRSDDESTISKIVETLSNNSILSRRTLLTRYFGYADKDVDAEFQKLAEEKDIFSENVKEG